MLRHLFFIFLGFVPSLIWLLFYLRKDKKPEPKRMVIKIFIYGMLITAPVAFIQLGFFYLLRGLSLPSMMTMVVYFLIGVALTEELARYLIIKLSVLKSSEFDEPVDAMIYMIIAGLGFAALENILVFTMLKEPYLLERTILMVSGRFIGATLLHALCSANIGFFLALSLFKTKKRLLLLISGLSISIILHGFFNIGIKIGGWQGSVIVLSILVLLFFIVLYQFKKLKKMPTICKIKQTP